MQHWAARSFWQEYGALSAEVRARADKQFLLLKVDAHHPSLEFKKVGERFGNEIRSARVTLNTAPWPLSR